MTNKDFKAVLIGHGGGPGGGPGQPISWLAAMLWRGRAGFWRRLRDRLPAGGDFSLGQILPTAARRFNFLNLSIFGRCYAPTFCLFFEQFCVSFFLNFFAFCNRVLHDFFS